MRLFKHLPKLTLNPDNAARLKQLVLELAARGKLTETWRQQHQGIEPASVLLKQIKTEKDKLIKEKKIKKEKPLPAISEDEVPYQLPEGWEWCRLGEISDYGNSEKIEPGNVDKRMWILELEDIEKVTSRLLKKVRYKDREFQSTKSRFCKGDVIYGKLRPYLDKVIVADEDGVCTTEMIPFRGYGQISSEYLRYFLKSPDFIRYADESTHGMNLPRLGTEKAREASIALPPLAEQKAIVKIVDELTQQIDTLTKQANQRIAVKKKLALSALHHLTQPEKDDHQKHWTFVKDHFPILFDEKENIKKLRESILQLAVQGKLTEAWRQQHPSTEPASVLLEQIKAEKEKLIKEKKLKKEKPLPAISEDEVPYELPEGWEWCRLGEISEIGTGATPLTSNPEYYGNGDVPWITSSATNQPFVFQAENFITERALSETNCKLYPSGTLVVAMYGQGKTRGQITELLISAATNQACATVNLLLKNGATKDFIKLYFQKIYEEIRVLASGGAQPNLNLQKIKLTILSFPPLAEQKAIVEIVEELMKLCDTLELQVKKAKKKEEQLMQSLIQDVFEGKEEVPEVGQLCLNL